MTQKQKELRKQRIKDILFKTLHIICYILSLLFILVCIVGGVQSCEKKPQSVSAETEKSLRFPNYLKFQIDDSYYTLTYKQSTESSFNISLANQDAWLKSQHGDIFSVFDQVDSSRTAGVDAVLSTPSYIVYNDVSYQISRLYLHYKAYLRSIDNYYYLRLEYLALNYLDYNGNSHGIYICQKQYTSAESLAYNSVNNEQYKIIVTNELYNNSFVQFFYDKNDISSFIFNKQFNYNAPLGTNIQGLYGSMTFDSSGANIRWKNYDVGYFVSNGQVYNQIQYTCIYSEGTSLLFGDGQVLDAPSGYWVYGWLSYVNTDTNHTDVVNRHDQIPFQHNGGTSLYYANSSTWINDQFRYINFLNPLDDNLTITLNSFNNNNQNYYSGQIYSDGYDVFTLLSLGFSSLSDFWQLQILPGISIGVLFFLPAVVGIIITIVHLLRK